MTSEEQVAKRLIEDVDGDLWLCLDKNSRFYGWLLYKHPDGKLVTKRMARPIEIYMAQAALEEMEKQAGISTESDA